MRVMVARGADLLLVAAVANRDVPLHAKVFALAVAQALVNHRQSTLRGAEQAAARGIASAAAKGPAHLQANNVPLSGAVESYVAMDFTTP